MFILLLLTLWFQCVQSDWEESGSGDLPENRVYFEDRGNNKKVDESNDDIFLDFLQSMMSKGKILRKGQIVWNDSQGATPEKSDEKAHSNGDVKPETNHSMTLYCNIFLLGLSLLALALGLLFLVLIHVRHKKISKLLGRKSSKIKSKNSEPGAVAPKESPSVPKIDFTFEMDENPMRRNKTKTTAERTFVRPPAKPELPPRRGSSSRSVEHCTRVTPSTSSGAPGSFPHCGADRLSAVRAAETFVTAAQIHSPPRDLE